MRGVRNSFLSFSRSIAYNLRDNRKAFCRIRGCDTNNDSLRRDVSRLGSCNFGFGGRQAETLPQPSETKAKGLKEFTI